MEVSEVMDQLIEYDKKAVKIVNYYWSKAVKLIRAREFFAEFLGTFVLVLLGDAAIAQVMFFSNGNITASGFLAINFGWGLGLTIALYVSIGITGGHLNPAVTFAMALRRRLNWLKVIPYWIAQFLGAFFAAAVVYGVYVDAIKDFGRVNCDNNTYTTNCTGGIFATYPKGFLTLQTGFFDQVIGTFMLLLGIFAICDSYNSEPKAGLKPIPIGLLLLVIGGTFGYNCGYAINPARDFGPRVFTAIAGWGKDVFVCSLCGNIRHWWWVPIIAPMVGAAAAAFVYWFLIDAHHTTKPDTSYEQLTGTNNGDTQETTYLKMPKGEDSYQS